MLRTKFAPFIAVLLFAPGVAVAADRSDGTSADLPCNSLCQRWMGLAETAEPDTKPLGTVDLHPAPHAVVSVSTPTTPAASPPLPPRRLEADRTDAAKHHTLKSALIAKASTAPAPREVAADPVAPAPMSVLGRSMVSAEHVAHVPLAERPARGVALSETSADIPNLPVASWTAPIVPPPQAVSVGAAPVVHLPELPPTPPPPSRDDVLAMLSAPVAAEPVRPTAMIPVAPSARPVATNGMPPAFDVIAALILDGARPFKPSGFVR